ncbi:helix-turn-helix transcriptional regulator [Sphingobium sp. MK2]|uniref:helix-turn-helix domain-containing protein n=1 Tax=Sphingobium sp. MK2 TaxID=3116540 RepID=UPI0032E35EE1
MNATVVPTAHRRVDVPGREDTVSLSNIGGRIAWARLRAKKSQKELAENIGKARATIVQYETNNIAPPTEVIEAMAKAMDVQPEFLAFGRHGIDGLAGMASGEILTMPEMKVGKNGEWTSGAFAVPKEMLKDYGVQAEDFKSIKVYILPQAAPEFNMGANSRLFVDTDAKDISAGRKFYLLRTPGGLEVVRPEPSFTAGDTVPFTGSTGQVFNFKMSELDFVGAVVGRIGPC